jgi:hypothetical protein
VTIIEIQGKSLRHRMSPAQSNMPPIGEHHRARGRVRCFGRTHSLRHGILHRARILRTSAITTHILADLGGECSAETSERTVDDTATVSGEHGLSSPLLRIRPRVALLRAAPALRARIFPAR